MSCQFDDTEVCQCRDNTVFSDGQCIPVSRCGCKDDDNVRHQVNNQHLIQKNINTISLTLGNINHKLLKAVYKYVCLL